VIVQASLPETVLQFGSGRFLRAFADLFIHEANEAGQNIGRVVIVQSTGGGERASHLEKQGGGYHVAIRGYQEGQVIDRVVKVQSVSRALVAQTQWPEVLQLACSPQLQFILSNTTENGYLTDPHEDLSRTPPESFPAKLLAVLLARYEAKQAPLTIIPCELIEGNANILKTKVLELAQKRKAPPQALAWIEECAWLHTLVDRIVSGTPKEHPLLAIDPMLIVAEPFAFFALQSHPKAAPFAVHPAIVRCPDVLPYFLRKVRILNAAHTALLIKAKPRGFEIVRDAVNDPELGAWLERLLMDEIVPTLQGRVDQPELFARQTLDRFRNPFLDHKFADIYLHHASKVQIRLVSTAQEYRSRFGTEPTLLNEVLELNRTLGL
jgi:tagaturonate reductase